MGLFRKCTRKESPSEKKILSDQAFFQYIEAIAAQYHWPLSEIDQFDLGELILWGKAAKERIKAGCPML